MVERLVPTDRPEMNGVVESFHAHLRRDYLDLVDIESERHGARILEAARLDYNHVKPKQRLGWRTPRQFYEEVTRNATSKPLESEQT